MPTDCRMAGCARDAAVEAHRARPCGHIEAPTVAVCSTDRHGPAAPNPSPCTTCGERNRLHLIPTH